MKIWFVSIPSFYSLLWLTYRPMGIIKPIIKYKVSSTFNSSHKLHLSGGTLSDLQIFDESQNWVMIVGGSCQKIFITSILLNQTDKVNPYNGMRFQCMFVSVTVYSYSHLKFSNQHLCPPWHQNWGKRPWKRCSHYFRSPGFDSLVVI